MVTKYEVYDADDNLITVITLGELRAGTSKIIEFKIKMLNNEINVLVKPVSGSEDAVLSISDTSDTGPWSSQLEYASWNQDVIKTFWLKAEIDKYAKSQLLDVAQLEVSAQIEVVTS